MATVQQQQMGTYTINVPNTDFKRFKGLAKVMGWTFEKNIEVDETEYVMSNPKIMESIREGEKAIASGNLKPVKLEDLWK